MKTSLERARINGHFALAMWDQLPILERMADDLGEAFAANLRGTLKNPGAPESAIESLTWDVRWRTGLAKSKISNEAKRRQ